jgi:glucokinase
MGGNETMYALGVDIGGTKVNIGLIDQNGHIMADHTLATKPEDRKVIERVIGGIEHLLSSIEGRVDLRDIRGIGIGSTGQIDFQRGTVHYATGFMPGYAGTPIRQMVKRKFEMPVYVDNDVNVLALTEKYFGVGKHVEHFLCLALGTGVGGAIMSNGRLLRGTVGAAGEFGHYSVNFNGPECSCGNRGCLELYASGTGIARRMNERLQQLSGGGALERVDAREAVRLWQDGDDTACKVMDETFKALSSALSSLIHAFNPQAIAIGGGLSEIGDPLFERLRRETEAKTMPSMFQDTVIVPAVTGNKSGMIGAAMQVWEYQH